MRPHRAARAEHNTTDEAAEVIERRRQTRGLVWMALGALGFAIVRAVTHGGVRSVFPQRWWK
jgi:hypothetical protein